MNRDKSKTLIERACKTIPGGVNSPVRAFKGVGGDLTSLEARMAGAVNQVSQGLGGAAKTAPDAKKDVGFFTAIKHMVTDVQLEARTETINADLKASRPRPRVSPHIWLGT